MSMSWTTCNYATTDGNPDDPDYYYCGFTAAHAGPHGHWQH
jgi:hypothetical protein